MKSYPSIPRDFRDFQAYCFDKKDGSNLRFEFSKKKGWYKFGTKTRLLDTSDPTFGPAIPLFQSTLAEPLTKIARDNRWESVIVFAEFWGKESFAGYHVDGDPKTLSLFDVAPYKQGILPPKEFIKLFVENPNVPTVDFIGQYHWTRGFVDRVWNEDVPGLSFEGCVGKAGSKHSDLVMAKAKCRRWIEKVKGKFTQDEAELLINS